MIPKQWWNTFREAKDTKLFTQLILFFFYKKIKVLVYNLRYVINKIILFTQFSPFQKNVGLCLCKFTRGCPLLFFRNRPFLILQRQTNSLCKFYNFCSCGNRSTFFEEKHQFHVKPLCYRKVGRHFFLLTPKVTKASFCFILYLYYLKNSEKRCSLLKIKSNLVKIYK